MVHCLQITLTLKNDRASTGKVVILLQLKPLESSDYEELKQHDAVLLPSEESLFGGVNRPYSADPETHSYKAALESSYAASRPGSMPPMPWTADINGFGMQSLVNDNMSASYKASNPTIFDPRVLQGDAKGRFGFKFKLLIEDIDVWDLANAHALTKNSPFIAAACGKWSATSSVSACCISFNSVHY
jgi:hypothetical protein